MFVLNVRHVVTDILHEAEFQANKYLNHEKKDELNTSE